MRMWQPKRKKGLLLADNVANCEMAESSKVKTEKRRLLDEPRIRKKELKNATHKRQTGKSKSHIARIGHIFHCRHAGNEY